MCSGRLAEWSRSLPVVVGWRLLADLGIQLLVRRKADRHTGRIWMKARQDTYEKVTMWLQHRGYLLCVIQVCRIITVLYYVLEHNAPLLASC